MKGIAVFTDRPLGCFKNLRFSVPAVTVLYTATVYCGTVYCLVWGGGMKFKRVPMGRSQKKEICTCTKVTVAGKDEQECNVPL